MGAPPEASVDSSSAIVPHGVLLGEGGAEAEPRGRFDEGGSRCSRLGGISGAAIAIEGTVPRSRVREKKHGEPPPRPRAPRRTEAQPPGR
eukprot:4935094-Alexandrium_andersonii.AAC.1